MPAFDCNSFPTSEFFAAQDVLKTEFDINHLPCLYVDGLDEFRVEPIEKKQLFLDLGIDKDILVSKKNTKVIYSGHRGCGKTTELFRLHNYLYNRDRYFSIFIPTEAKKDINNFQPEDFFSLLIGALIRDTSEVGLDINFNQLDKLMHDWYVTDDEIIKEWNQEKAQKVEASGGINFNFLTFLVAKFSLSGSFSENDKYTRKFREKIRTNYEDLTKRLNTSLIEISEALAKNNLGKDIIFIFDGTEKIPYESYKNLFIDRVYWLLSIEAPMICSVPINSYYDISHSPTQGSFHKEMLPMLKIENDRGKACIRQIIEKRIKTENFFEADTLDYLITKSGGCLRQLLLLTQRTLTLGYALERKATIDDAKAVCHKLGGEMFGTLTKTDLELLKGEVDAYQLPADPTVQQLLFGLVLLKYNGRIKINPVVADYLNLQS